MKQPNIVFILADDQRFDTISALGNREIETPNMDRLVKTGTSFTHAHIMGSTSAAVCMPSRAMMLTGRTLFSIQGAGETIPASHAALPEWFRNHGYITTHVGKWHQDREAYNRCFSSGAKIFGFNFERGWYEGCNGHWHLPVHNYDPTGTYDKNGGYFLSPIEPFDQPYETCKENGRHSSEAFSDSAIEFIRDFPKSEPGKKGKPFFMYLAYLAPHDPRQYPMRWREFYNDKDILLPENFMIQHPFDNGEMLVRDELLAAHPRKREDIRRHIRDYYAIISHLDEQIGRVLDSLEQTGQADNTIIVFSGDNGLAVGQHGLMGKQNLYDHSVRVPLIMAGPGIARNRKSDAFCYLLDVFPTLCELTDIAVPDTVEGKSLLPIIRQQSVAVRDILYLAYKGIQRAVRQRDWKLIEYVVNGKQTTQLFNLKNDPHEISNIADKPEHRHILDLLRKELLCWKTEMGDTREMSAHFWDQFR
ncbi:MAG: sulfatase-like hydrolase/transferase [Verrucomicrobiota bacterium]